MPADSLQMQVERSPERDADGQFVRGRSGNPAGRMPGSRNRATMMAEQLFDGASAPLANKAVQLALDGDAGALKLCLSRIIAPRRHRPSGFSLPPLTSAADLAPALAAVAAAAADGAISTGEAWEMAQIVDTYIRAFEAGEFAARLARLEAVHGLAQS